MAQIMVCAGGLSEANVKHAIIAASNIGGVNIEGPVGSWLHGFREQMKCVIDFEWWRHPQQRVYYAGSNAQVSHMCALDWHGCM